MKLGISYYTQFKDTHLATNSRMLTAVLHALFGIHLCLNMTMINIAGISAQSKCFHAVISTYIPTVPFRSTLQGYVNLKAVLQAE